MKKIALFMLVLSAAFTVNAQVYLGGSLGFWHTGDESDGYAFSILPEVGYNFNSKWALGGKLGYIRSDKGQGNDLDIISFSPYTRFTYYEKGIVRLFVDGGLGAVVYAYDGGASLGLEIGFKPGIAVKLSDRFSLISNMGFLGCRYQYPTTTQIDNADGFGVDLSSANMTFGLLINF